MRQCILYHNKNHYDLLVAVRAARRQFMEAPHTARYQPRALYLNPLDAPDMAFIDNLEIKIDPQMPVHHIRLASNPLELPEYA